MIEGLIFYSDLFGRDGVECPEWLSDQKLEDYWLSSDYSCEDDVHLWEYRDFARWVVLSWDGTECLLRAFDEDGVILFARVRTEEFEVCS